MFGRFFGRGPESRGAAPDMHTPKTEDSHAEGSEACTEENREIMVNAIAEYFWDTGMTQGMEGTPEERKEAARDMAEAALALVPDKFESLPATELTQNKHHLVAEAVRLYKETIDTPAHQSDQEILAAK